MTGRTFKRYELKFMLDPDQFGQVRQLLPEHMEPDAFCRGDGTYMIYNLYFDTDQDAIIRTSLAGPKYKEKLRLRCYALPRSDRDCVYLELKKKIDGLVSKRRATLPYGDAKRFLASRQMPDGLSYVDRQVLDEIAVFLERHPATPKVFLSYERLALHGREDPDLRITFDRSILTRRDHPDFSAGDYGNELLEDDGILMEVKTSGAVPLWLAHELSRLGIRSQGFSKYGAEYLVYRQAQLAGTANRTACSIQSALHEVPQPARETSRRIPIQGGIQTCSTRYLQLPGRRS